MNDFIAVIEDLIKLVKELVEIEQTKLDAASKNLVTYVEDCMNQEQAAVLKLKGLDKKREKCQEDLGYKGYTFRQILSETTGDEHGQLKTLFDTLSHYVSIFQDTSECAHSILEINLHTINKAIQGVQNSAGTDKPQWEGNL